MASGDPGTVDAIRPCATCAHTADSCSECGGLYGYNQNGIVLPPCIQCRRNRPPIGTEPPPDGPPMLAIEPAPELSTSEPSQLDPPIQSGIFDAHGALQVREVSPLVRVLAEMCHQFDAALSDPDVLADTNAGIMKRLDVRERWKMISARLGHYIGIDQAKRDELNQLLQRAKQLVDRT